MYLIKKLLLKGWYFQTINRENLKKDQKQELNKVFLNKKMFLNKLLECI